MTLYKLIHETQGVPIAPILAPGVSIQGWRCNSCKVEAIQSPLIHAADCALAAEYGLSRVSSEGASGATAPRPSFSSKGKRK